MKFSRLFRLGKQGYDMYRNYKGEDKRRDSSNYKKRGDRQRGGTLERLARKLLR